MLATDTDTFTTKRGCRERERHVFLRTSLDCCPFSCCCCCCCLLAFGTNCSKNVFYNLPGNWKRSPLALLAPFLFLSLWFLFLFAVCWFAFIVTHTHIAFHLASKRGGAAFCGLDWALKIYALPHKEATEIEAKSWRAQRGRKRKERERECATKSRQASETLKTRSAGSGSRGTKQIKIQLQMARAGNENET